jgi:hypothetical protein
MHRSGTHKISRYFLVLTLLITGIFIMPALAQGTGGVKGKLRNVQGELIAGATVTARQNAKDVKTTKTGSKGEFVLDGLNAGVYTIAFDAKGYSLGVRSNVEVKGNKIKDLDRLILTIDRGTRVIVRGSVFFKEGASASGVLVEMVRVGADGSTQKLGQAMTNYLGEFELTTAEGAAKLRLKATYKHGTGVKEIDVDSAMVYRLAISLDISRTEK